MEEANEITVLRRLVGECADLFTVTADWCYEVGLDPMKDDVFVRAGKRIRSLAKTHSIDLSVFDDAA